MSATQIVHWPGRDTAACDDHANKLRALARGVFGIDVSSTALPPDAEVPCGNCVNEAKVKP
jgi:hypothetical protein